MLCAENDAEARPKHRQSRAFGLYRDGAGTALLRQQPQGAAAQLDADGPYCRVHLGYLKETGLAPETLFRLFVLSAEEPSGGTATLEEKLAALLSLAEAGKLPFPPEKTAAAVETWRKAGFPACRHSERFRAAYHPAYRVIGGEFVWRLPLLAAIDQKRTERERVTVAIEGGSASGKTTLAVLLTNIYDCKVFHMDDFFLRPEQRTAERLLETTQRYLEGKLKLKMNVEKNKVVSVFAI